nr:hypothetical protein [Tanacetum cinerariifolium]
GSSKTGSSKTGEVLQPQRYRVHRKELYSTKVTTELRVLQRQDVADAGSRERSSFGQRAAIADDCDVFDSYVDEAPTAQTMFMANLSSADPVTDEAGLSYNSDILSEVQDHDHYQDAICAHHEEHMMHDGVQLGHVVYSHADYTSDSNMIPHDQHVKDNEVSVVHKDTLEIAEITRKKMNAKMNDPECVTRKVKIAPHDYTKENFLATFTP